MVTASAILSYLFTKACEQKICGHLEFRTSEMGFYQSGEISLVKDAGKQEIQVHITEWDLEEIAVSYNLVTRSQKEILDTRRGSQIAHEWRGRKQDLESVASEIWVATLSLYNTHI